MNPHLTLALNAAVAVPFGTAPHNAASALCELRGIDPNAIAPGSIVFGAPLYNWQLVVAEELLTVALRKELPV